MIKQQIFNFKIECWIVYKIKNIYHYIEKVKDLLHSQRNQIIDVTNKLKLKKLLMLLNKNK